MFGVPKTASGERVVELDSRTLQTLIGHRVNQELEQAAWGPAYQDFDLIFTQENGRPLDPSRVTSLFTKLAAEAGLRRIRLHDLRHGSASLMLAAGIPVEVVSKRLGHSRVGVTIDVYSHMLEGTGRQAAERAMGLVPRAHSTTPEPSRDHLVTTCPRNNDVGTDSEESNADATRGNTGAPGGIRTPNLLIRRRARSVLQRALVGLRARRNSPVVRARPCASGGPVSSVLARTAVSPSDTGACAGASPSQRSCSTPPSTRIAIRSPAFRIPTADSWASWSRTRSTSRSSWGFEVYGRAGAEPKSSGAGTCRSRGGPMRSGT